MGKIIVKNAKAIICCDKERRVLRNHSILIDENKISKIAPFAELDCLDAEVIEAEHMLVFPGLINTHHHLLQGFTRNIPKVQNMELFDWLKVLYHVWKKIDTEFEYYSSVTAMGELLRYGCTTVFDQHFAYPAGAGKGFIDAEMQAAEDLGVRIVSGRSCFTRGEKQGGLPPDELVETIDEVLEDSERVVKKYHDPDPFAMKQIVLAPCSPFSVDADIMRESVRLARKLGVRSHTHLCETLDEERYCLEVYGKRPLAWMEEVEFFGPDVWYAHGIHFNTDELHFLAETKTGVAHCPISNMKLSSGICRVPEMLELGVPVGLGVDGSASQDGSNLLEELRVAYLLHRLQSSNKAPTGQEILSIATLGGARILGREDSLGSLEEGKAADLFTIDVSSLDYVGALEDEGAFLAVIGYKRPAAYTIVNGKICVKNGLLLNINEEEVKRQAKQAWNKAWKK